MRLTIGRLGIPVEIDDPAALTLGRGNLSLSGDLSGATLDETRVLRDELIALAAVEEPVALTWAGGPEFDGFYVVRDAGAQLISQVSSGLVRYSLELGHLGSAADLEFRSIISGTVMANSFGVTAAVAEFFHAPPQGHTQYTTGATIPTSVNRTGSDGAIAVYTDLPLPASPKWTVTPAKFYSGAAKITVNGGERIGLRAPYAASPSWQLENSLVRVTPNGTNGRLSVAHHDGSAWETAKVFSISVGGAEVPAWASIAILRNTPEEVAIRLTAPFTSGAGRHTLDISLRRGSRFIACYLQTSTSATLAVVRTTTEASTTVRASGTLRATSNDAGANRFVLGSATTNTLDLVNGGLSKTSVTVFDFFIGSEIGGTGAGAQDVAAKLELQYLANLIDRTTVGRR